MGTFESFVAPMGEKVEGNFKPNQTLFSRNSGLFDDNMGTTNWKVIVFVETHSVADHGAASTYFLIKYNGSLPIETKNNEEYLRILHGEFWYFSDFPSYLPIQTIHDQKCSKVIMVYSYWKFEIKHFLPKCEYIFHVVWSAEFLKFIRKKY